MAENFSAQMNVPEARQPRDAGFISRRVLAVAGSLAAAAGSVAGVSALSGEGSQSVGTTTTAASYEVGNGCDDLTQAFAASDRTYEIKAFLPHIDIDDAKGAVASLFDENGPLSNKGDLYSLAAMWSALGKPATDKEGIDPAYDFSEEFRSSIARYSETGLEQAKADCEVIYNTAIQTAEATKAWVSAGDTVLLIGSLRDDNYNLNGMKPRTIVVGEDLDGISFAVRPTTDENNVDGFNELLITANGEIYVKGITKGKGGVEVVVDSPDVVSIDTTSPTTIPVNEGSTTSSSAPEVADTSTTSTTVGKKGTSPTTDPQQKSGSATSTSVNGGNNGTAPHGSQPSATSIADAPGVPNTSEDTPTDVPATNGTTPSTGTTPGNGTTPNTTPNTGTTPTGTTTPNTTPKTTVVVTAPPTMPPMTVVTTIPAPTTTVKPKGAVPPTTGCDEFNPCSMGN